MEENKNNNNTEKKYNEKNLTFSIILAAIILSLTFIHSLLGWCGVSGNLTWFILNLIFAAGALAIAVVGGLFFFKVTKDNLKNDIPSFVVSLAAFALAAICTFWWSIDMIINLVGFIKELANK